MEGWGEGFELVNIGLLTPGGPLLLAGGEEEKMMRVSRSARKCGTPNKNFLRRFVFSAIPAVELLRSETGRMPVPRFGI